MEIQQQQDFTEDCKVNEEPIGGGHDKELDLDQNVPQDTVLFDKNPRIDYPLRIDPPFSMKVPERDQSCSSDEIIQENIFAPSVFARQLKDLKALLQSASERYTGMYSFHKHTRKP